MTTTWEGKNFFECAKPGSMGLCIGIRFVRCYWPSLDEPVALFADGSGGIEVQGPPTPRNVVFPPDTVFLPVVVNDAKLGEPARWRVTDVPTRGDCFFLRTREMREVEEEQEVTEERMIRGGLRIVRAILPVFVKREVEVIEELTAEQARAYAKTGGR